MLRQRIHSILQTIANETYPGLIRPFTIEVIAKEMRGRHGDYNSQSDTIRIFNLSRETTFIISTSIHELAHHAEKCLHGSTGHQKQFYICLRDLLAAAIRRGFIDYHIARTKTDSRDLKMLEKYFGDVLTSYKALNETDGNYLVKVFKAFTVKDLLRARGGYRWSDLETAWCKEISEAQVDEERAFLLTLLPAEHISIVQSRDATIDAVYHVIIQNAFSHKDQLKARGYYFNGYGYKNNTWVKRLPAQQLSEEKTFLNHIGCKDFKVEGKKPTKSQPTRR